MTRFVLVAALAALSFAASNPARADYAIVQFTDGNCRIWWDSAGAPWGVGWTKVAVGPPDHVAAETALDSAYAQRICR
jgi:hypothetical protein